MWGIISFELVGGFDFKMWPSDENSKIQMGYFTQHIQLQPSIWTAFSRIATKYLKSVFYYYACGHASVDMQEFEIALSTRLFALSLN